ncbi:MAG: hypothetical protein ACE5OR_06340, partial [bacterium]
SLSLHSYNTPIRVLIIIVIRENVKGVLPLALFVVKKHLGLHFNVRFIARVKKIRLKSCW